MIGVFHEPVVEISVTYVYATGILSVAGFGMRADAWTKEAFEEALLAALPSVAGGGLAWK